MKRLAPLLAILGILCGHAFAADKPARPNILFLLADDLGYGDLGCYGHPRTKTPNLDRLARDGTRFTQFYVHPLCSPTRAAAITGQFPSRWRIFAHLASLTANTARGMPHWLDAQAPSMPRALQQAGYRTAHFGKWHLGGGSGSFRDGALYINHPDAPPVASYGFDVVRADFGNAPTWKHAQPVDKPHESYPYDEPEWQTWSSRAISDATIGFLDDHARHHQDQSFLAHVWLKDPHTPMQPTDAMRAPYADVKEPAQTHYAMVSFMDEQIGRILNKLEALGLRENTLVLFASDNGGVVNRGASNGRLRGGKVTLYEGGIRVPFIARWPGQVPAGRVDEASLLNVCDLAPTFCQLAGAAMPGGYPSDGVDAGDALRGQPFRRTAPMLWHHPTGGAQSPALAIRDGDWKLMMDPSGARLALYNLANDSSEKRDVAAENPEVVGRLKTRLVEWNESLPQTAEGSSTHQPGVEVENALVTPGFTIIRPAVTDERGQPLDNLNGFCRGAPIRLADGRLMMAFGDDPKRFSDSSALFTAFSSDSGRTWTEAKRIEQNPDPRLRHGRPTALQARDGTIWVFYFAWLKYDGTPAGSSSDVWAVSSVDGGKSFGNRRKIWVGYTGMLQGAIETRDGNLVVPVSFLGAPQQFRAGCIVSTDGGRNWRYSSVVTIGDVDAGLRATTKLNGGALEPSVVELRDGRIFMTLRTIVGKLYESHSIDGALTWSPPVESAVSCGGTQYLTRLASGRIAMVWNPADRAALKAQKWPNGYSVVAIAFSTDEGRTWTKPVTIAHSTNGTRLVHTLLVEPTPGQFLLTMPERNFLLSANESDLIDR